MKIPTVRTRNFSLGEVIHRPRDVTKQEQIEIGLVALGYVQALRDALWEHYGREVPVLIESGYRGLVYNREIGSSDTSLHRWRNAPSGLIWALDISSKVLPAAELFRFCKDRVRGETYLHQRLQFVHIGPAGPDEEWTQ